jgi:hypothetical protein
MAWNAAATSGRLAVVVSLGPCDGMERGGDIGQARGVSAEMRRRQEGLALGVTKRPSRGSAAGFLEMQF